MKRALVLISCVLCSKYFNKNKYDACPECSVLPSKRKQLNLF